MDIEDTKSRLYRVFIKYCVFPKNSRKFATSPSPTLGCYAIGCTKNYQPIGETEHSHCVERFEGLYSDIGEGGVAVKKPNFPEHPV